MVFIERRSSPACATVHPRRVKLMLSRVAESLYWMSRYTERAVNVGRFVDVNLHLLLDMPGLLAGQWEALIKITGDEEDFRKRYNHSTDQNVIEFLTFDQKNPNSIISCITAARSKARSMREILSSETWEELNIFFLNLTSSDSQQRANENPAEFFREVRRAGHSITGAMAETMSYEEAWHFACIGQLLERADKTTRILDLKYFLLLPNVTDVGTPTDDIHWSAILRSANAFEMYRKVHGRVTSEHIIQFLMLNAEFPRSIHFCLNNAESSLRAITGTPYKQYRNPAERRLGQLVSELDYTDYKEVIANGLHQFLDDLQGKLNTVDDSMYKTFFSFERPL